MQQLKVFAEPPAVISIAGLIIMGSSLWFALTADVGANDRRIDGLEERLPRVEEDTNDLKKNLAVISEQQQATIKELERQSDAQDKTNDLLMELLIRVRPNDDQR